ncbi:MAG: GAF domain-containing sensor histidine kinase [Balneolia bacterium]|nr:GAF domain-containing sensor histidine kinase [Balneolia bacterium]
MDIAKWHKEIVCPVPENETKRLEALSRYEALDSPPIAEETFDRLVRLSARFTGLPVAFIHLLTRDKQYPKGSVGFSYDEMPRSESFCQFTIMQNDIYEVEDPLNHPIFKNHPAVHGEMKIRYYVGVPLQTPDGYNIGTLCLIDHKPNKINEDDKDTLRILADEIVSQYELKYAKALAEQHNKQKDELIRIISHDLRNPLMGITGFAEYLTEELTDPEHIEILNIIRESGMAVARVVNILLNSPYINKSMFKLNTELTDVSEIVRDSYRLLNSYSSIKKQRIKLKLPDHLEWKVDPDKWRLIVSNLINNAIKFTPDEGLIEIKLGVSARGKELELEVSDTGIGMNEKLKKELFSGNASVQRKGTSGEVSSGIGMTIIKKFCDLHGGTIHVESEQGKGSRFLVSIPG